VEKSGKKWKKVEKSGLIKADGDIMFFTESDKDSFTYRTNRGVIS
jgi:hypothetical protein